MTGSLPRTTLSKLETVDRFFAGTGFSYDHMVAWGTCGLDRLWKRRLLAQIPEHPTRIVDQACGTGIVTMEIARRYPDCHVTGVELRDEYLQRAREKARALRMANVDFVLGRAEDVVSAQPCDAIVSSYLAKYAELPPLIANAAHMLRPGGVMALHDFACPRSPVIRLFWQAYLRLLRFVGRRLAPEWRIVFDELPTFLRQTRWVQESTVELARNGFAEITTESLFFGAAALVTGTKAVGLPR